VQGKRWQRLIVIWFHWQLADHSEFTFRVSMPVEFKALAVILVLEGVGFTSGLRFRPGHEVRRRTATQVSAKLGTQHNAAGVSEDVGGTAAGAIHLSWGI